ncbi:MAG: acetate--CoA ligase family protein [Gammaproteobacteria bacterium]
MLDDQARLLFNPQSVAIIGASSDTTKASGYPLRNLLAAKYGGTIYPVNPRVQSINGIETFASILDVPGTVDVAIIMLDAALVPQVIAECGQKGVKAAIVGASGFSESGEAGIERQAQLAKAASEYRMRICGPNCHGVYNVVDAIPLGYNISFGLQLLPGSVAIVSQSGALLGSLAARTLRTGLGLSYLVSSGNEVDLDLCDYLEFLLEDDSTEVIALLIEGLKDGNRFLRLTKQAHATGKTIVALKVGKSERGAVTTMAHTSRMAGSGEVYEAAFRQFGVISTDSVETFLGAAQLAAGHKAPRSGKVMILTASGAGASLMADKASEYGVELAEISADTASRIPQRKTAILTNPCDTAGQSRSPGFLASLCDAFASDPANDCLLLFLGPLAVRHEYASHFCRAAKAAGKPAAAVVTLADTAVEEVFKQHNVPFFDFCTDPCIKTLRSFIRYGRFLITAQDSVPSGEAGYTAPVRTNQIFKVGNRLSMLSEGATGELLRNYGFSTPEHLVINSLADARKAAEAIGYPLIMKAAGLDVGHKSDAGLVSARVLTESDLAREFESLQQHAKALQAGSDRVNVSVEQYIDHKYEFIIGLKTDEIFGSVILFGMGGVFTEILGDYVIGLLPLTATDARGMLFELKAASVLKKLAAKGELTLDQLTNAITRISRLGMELKDKIIALDINPIVFTSSCPHGIVLDAKVHLQNSGVAA